MTKIELLDPGGLVVAEVRKAKRVILRTPFGAMRARCFVNLYEQDRQLPIHHSSECRVLIDGLLKFGGRIVDVRRFTQGDELSFHAVREPELELTEGVSGLFENKPDARAIINI